MQEIHPSFPWVNIFLPFHIQWRYSLNRSTTKWKPFDSCHITMKMSCIKNSNSLTMEEIHKIKFTMRFIYNEVFDINYGSHQMPSNCLCKVFWPILIVWCQNWLHYVLTSLCWVIYFVNLLPSPAVWLFDIWHLLDNLTSQTFWHLSDIWTYFWHFDTWLLT